MLLAAFSLAYISDIVLRASSKYFWVDEIYTLNVCRASTWSGVKQAPSHGADHDSQPSYF